MESPITRSVISQNYFSGPSWTMPAEQYGRSIDRFPNESQGASAPATATIPPLWLTSPNATHLKISFGQVNGITPSGGWAGGGDDVGVLVDISGYSAGTYNIYVDATLPANGVPTAVTITSSTSAVSAHNRTHAYRLNGQAVVAAGAVPSI